MNRYWVFGIVFIVFLIRQILVEIGANEKDKKRYPAMYVGSDWQVNDPFWIKHEHDGQLIKNPKYLDGVYLNEEGIKLKKEMNQ